MKHRPFLKILIFALAFGCSPAWAQSNITQAVFQSSVVNIAPGIYTSDPIVIPSGCTVRAFGAVITPSSNYTGGPFWTVSSGADLSGAQISNVSGPVIYGSNVTAVKVHDLSVSNIGGHAIYILNGTRCQVYHNDISRILTAYSYGIICMGGSRNIVSNNLVQETSLAGFGIQLRMETGSQVIANNVHNTYCEAINFTDCSSCQLQNNVCTWDDGTANDFGISLNSYEGWCNLNQVSGNRIDCSGKAGIAVWDSSVGAFGDLGNTVDDNLIHNWDTLQQGWSGITQYGNVYNFIGMNLSYPDWSTGWSPPPQEGR